LGIIGKLGKLGNVGKLLIALTFLFGMKANEGVEFMYLRKSDGDVSEGATGCYKPLIL
tara:strand:- start:349 stop:522 length:174 start_codon:yes stop_codon:yes gene_type:complete